MSDVFRISKDAIRAKDLFEIANERVNEIVKAIPKDKHYKIIEEYYEAIIELITAIMYLDGWKTLNHVNVIEYLSRYPDFSPNQIRLIDTMRKMRHGIVYYGRKISGDFLINNKEEIIKIIKSLNKVVEKNL